MLFLIIIFPIVQADEEEGEFDSDAELNALGGMGGLGEGEFLTAEERAAYLRRFEEENEEEESEQVSINIEVRVIDAIISKTMTRIRN